MKAQLLLTDFLDRAVSLYGDKVAIIDEERVLTYAEWNKRIQQLSHGFTSLGIQKGDRIAYLAPNTLEMSEGFFGVLQTGAIMVPLNTRLVPKDYEYILNHSESKILVVDRELLPLIEPIREQLTSVQHILVHGQCKNENATIGYDAWLSSFPSQPFLRPDIKEDNICSLLYTSGTTGRPKGVMLSQRNNYLHALYAQHHLRVTDQDVMLYVVPLFHANGWGGIFYYTANGSTQIMLRKVDPQSILTKIQQYNVSIIHMAPTVLNSVLETIDQTKSRMKQKLRIIVAGSAPPLAFVKRVEQDLGWEFIQVYGMTELSPFVTISYIRQQYQDWDESQKYRTKAKAGVSMIGCNVQVVKSDGTQVARDGVEIGEVIVKGHSVMQGYWRNEEATKDTIRNGWLYTSDMAVVDKYGQIDIVDRKKDVIISGGENISSIEVEGVFYDHPDVIECAVIAIPSEKWGESPHAVIVLRPGAKITEEELIQYSRSRLAHFKCPKSISFTDELPKTGSGKIQKVELRKEFWQGNRKVN